MKKRGKGMAIMWYPVGPAGTPHPSAAVAQVNEDGRLVILTGATDVGQGSTTILSQIAADTLGVPVEWVRLVTADTEITPPDFGTLGSRVTYVTGQAVRLAVEQAKQMILSVAADLLKASADDLEIRNARVWVREDPDSSIDLPAVAQESILKRGKPPVGTGSFVPPTTQADRETGQGTPFPTYVYATHMAEVEVDTDTGEVSVLRLVAAHDSGVVINPMLTEGQIAGGVAQGIGMALSEEILLRDGRTLNPSLMDYTIPSALEVPDLQFIHVETPDDTGPYGAKCVGEPSLIATAPAILNAIHDAVGVRIYDLPATPEKILRALKSAAEPLRAASTEPSGQTSEHPG